jgi:hypothetical protein
LEQALRRRPSGDVSEPGLDMIMIDAEAMPAEPELAADQPQVEDISWTGAPVDLLKPIHHSTRTFAAS